MRHVSGFSNNTKIRYMINGFGMYGTVNDLFTRTATVAHGEALRLAMAGLLDGPGSQDPATGRVSFSYAHPLFWAPFVMVGD